MSAHLLPTTSLLITLFFFFSISDVEVNHIFPFRPFFSLSRSLCPSLPLLSLSCTLLVSPKSKRAVVSPFCLPHLWCSMGHWLDNDRQTEHGAAHKAKEGANRPNKMEDKTLIGCLTKVYQGSGLADKRFAVAALALPHIPPTHANVWHALCVSRTVLIWGGKEAEDGISITRQMRALRTPPDQNWYHVSFLPLLVLQWAKAQRLVKTLIYCTITVIE